MQIGPLLQWWQFLLGSWFIVAGHAQVNVTLQSTAPEIVYSPPACNSTVASCDSAWQVIPSPAGLVTSTSGPTADSGEVVPQLFLTFTGTSLYIRTSSLSTATANVTLSTENPSVSLTTEVDTAASLITVIGLPGDRSTTLVVTFIRSSEPTRLDISNFTILTPNNDTNPFSSTALPHSTFIPAFTPIVSVAPLPHATHDQTGADIAAEVLGAVLGVTLVGVGFIAARYYRKRKRRLADLPTAGGS